jgi:flagellar biosynthesis protein FlhA
MSTFLKTFFGDRRDTALVLLVLGVLAVLFAPIPPFLLDLLIVLNISLSILILLVTFYTESPLSFSTFPSILLVVTMFRLALNVSSTRLILEDASAGEVIAAVGTYVIGGNYVVGIVVFSILIVVQYVVVTNGAQRVAEVAARFTLDSMPGKQMSIDADINMGLIDDVEAKRRRSLVEKEANFYGAMDGATKFVKGDAIAGVIIILINIIGGLLIGVLQRGMSWGEALKTYTLLTVGDGIVTQIPSLVIAVGTGIIITRAATDAQLGQEISSQLFANRRSISMVTVLLVFLLLLPGMPKIPVLIVLAMAGGILLLMRGQKIGGITTPESSEKKAEPAKEEDLYGLVRQDPITLQFASTLYREYNESVFDIKDKLADLRKQIARDFGLVIPEPSIQQQRNADSNGYEIWLHGARIGSGSLRVDSLLAINSSESKVALIGEQTTEPAYGLPAVWVARDTRAIAKTAGYTLVDAETVLITHISELLRANAAELLTRAETERLVGRVKQKQASLVEELNGQNITLSDIQKVLQQLLREHVHIGNLEMILEVLVDVSRTTKNADELVERVRERMGASICQRLLNERGELAVMTIAPELERSMVNGLRSNDVKLSPLADFALVERLIRAIGREVEAASASGRQQALLCASPLRRLIRSVTQRSFPYLSVIGINEVPATLNVQSVAVINAH